MKIPFWPPFKGIRNIEFGLNRILDLLARLDNPHKKLPPTIHFAGTNGKGSSLNFLYQILKSNNFKVHCYTSPHLIEFNERIILANSQITDEFLNECLKICQEKSEIYPQIPVTFFEGITCAAFLAFSKIKADFMLLETGMGGRLDATNVLDKVLASVITPISFDHTDFLGNSLEKIAIEKAGIIKENCPVIIGKQPKEALEVLKKQALLKNAKTIIFNEDFKIKKHQNYFEYIDNSNNIKIPNPEMSGSHQIENLSLALSTFKEIMPDNFKNQNFRTISKTIWPARLQKITLSKPNPELYIDGSHNEAGALTVLEFLKSKKNNQRIVIYSSLSDKDYQNFLKIISKEIDELIITNIPNEPKSQDPEIISKIATKFHIKNRIEKEISNLIFENISNKPTTILITGSLYSAGFYLEKFTKLDNPRK